MTRLNKKMLGGLAIVSLAIGGACASNKPVTGVERVTQDQKSYEESDKKITKAQNELESFQNTLKELQASYKQGSGETMNDEMASSLARLSLKIQQSELDLNDLRVRNKEASRAFDRRLQEAAAPNNRSSDRSAAE